MEEATGSAPRLAQEEVGVVSPPAVLAAVSSSNSSYIQLLESTIAQLDVQIASKEKKEDLLKSVLTAKHVPSMACLFRIPYFADKTGCVAPPMPAEIEAECGDPDEPSVMKTIWKKEHDVRLAKLVKETRLQSKITQVNGERLRIQARMRQLQKQRDELTVTASGESSEDLDQKIQVDNALLDKIRDQLKLLEADVVPDALLAGIELKEYDWYQLGRDPVLERHGDKSCKQRFENLIDPDLRYGKWNRQERKKLKSLVEKHKNDWEAIAGELPGRKPFICCAEYQKMDVTAGVDCDMVVVIGSFNAAEVATLIYSHIVCDGVYSLMGKMLPERTVGQIQKYWATYLEKDVKLEKWTPGEMNIMADFAAKSRSPRLRKLYAMLPERQPAHVARQFRWKYDWDQEKNVWVDLPGTSWEQPQMTAHYATTLESLHRHVFEKIVEPLHQDGSLTLQEVLRREEVISPVAAYLSVLNIDHIGKPADRVVDPVVATQYTLTAVDRKLIQLFASDNIIRPTNLSGRPRKDNPFGSIPVDAQPKTEEEALSAVAGALKAEGAGKTAAVLIPPSEVLLDAWLKLKSLIHNMDVSPVDVAALSEIKTDVFPVVQKMTSLFLTTEIMLSDPADLEEPVTTGKKRKRKYRPVNNKTLLKRRMYGGGEAKKAQVEERRERSESTEAVPVLAPPPKKRAKKKQGPKSPRRSSRLQK